MQKLPFCPLVFLNTLCFSILLKQNGKREKENAVEFWKWRLPTGLTVTTCYSQATQFQWTNEPHLQTISFPSFLHSFTISHFGFHSTSKAVCSQKPTKMQHLLHRLARPLKFEASEVYFVSMYGNGDVMKCGMETNCTYKNTYSLRKQWILETTLSSTSVHIVFPC